MTKVIKEEFEKLRFLEINNGSFAGNTQLGTLCDEFNRLSSIDNDLFTYEIEVPKSFGSNKQAGSLTHNDLGDYEDKISYEECEKIYVEAVIFNNNRLVRLIDVTVEQWLDLKYGNHMTMDVNVKKEWMFGMANWMNDGYFPGAYIVGNSLRYQDLEWYEPLEDGELKEEALMNKAIMEGLIDEDDESSKEGWRSRDDYVDANHDHEREDENEHDDGERRELFDDVTQERLVCLTKRYVMIKYSFEDDEKYVAIKEDEYNDSTSTNEEACRAYQEIFRKMDEGWMITRDE
ncbi:hypothetical protein Tco_1578791 [Tanacetum coccineum]